MFHVKHQIKHREFSTGPEELKSLYNKFSSKLDLYVDKLIWWNKRINLVSRNVPRETLVKHVEHSLLLCFLDEVRGAKRIIDTGTGGGLPGIPLAIVLDEKEFVLNDIIDKKIMAVKQLAADVGVKDRIEFSSCSVADLDMGGGVIVTKHAFKVNELYNMVADKDWNSIIMMKGREEAENELSGITDQLSLVIYDLESSMNDEFYEGKALVDIRRVV